MRPGSRRCSTGIAVSRCAATRRPARCANAVARPAGLWLLAWPRPPGADIRLSPPRAGPGRETQWSALFQSRPRPTETSSGTAERVGAAHRGRGPGLRAAPAPPRATSKTSSSWTWSSIRERRPASSMRRVDAEHRDLDDVGGGALDRRVERHPLGHLAALAVVADQVGQVAAAAEDGFGVAVLAGAVDDRPQVVADAAEALEVFLHQRRGPLRRRCRAAGTGRRRSARTPGRSSSP